MKFLSTAIGISLGFILPLSMVAYMAYTALKPIMMALKGIGQ
jgi:hypothetical protein